MALLLIFPTVIRWFVFRVFLYTDWFNGPQQFVVQQFGYFMLDMYLMMYCPYTWIRESVRNNWAGWAQRGRRGEYFYFVRKPDPREELLNKGYFKKSGKFIYLRRNTTTASYVIEKKLNCQTNDSAYVVRKPESTTLFMSPVSDCGLGVVDFH